MIMECKIHGASEFAERSDGGYRCKKCASESASKRRKKIKAMSVEYKGGKCSICGYNKCIDALEFHHIDSEDKKFGISRNGHSRKWNDVKKELDKCILVCANCHREIHSNYKKV